MAKVELKQPIIDEIKSLLDGAVSVTAVKYIGLTVEQDTQLRKQLREAGVTYKVFKNTLIKRAAEGPTAIAVSKDDAAAAARIIKKFAKDAPVLELKAAVAEGTYYDSKAVLALADIPSREELLSRLCGSLQSPVTNFARVLKQVAEKNEEPAA